MLQRIIHFSIHNKLIVGIGVIGLVIYGLIELTRLPIDAVPDITDNQVQVITVAPSLGAPDIERLITFPVEQANSNIPGTKEIRSFSRFGLSLVTIVFNDNVDIYLARQQVSERLGQLSAVIPAEIGTPELGPVTTGLGEIYQYAIRPLPGYESKYSTTELRTIQDWIVRRQLLGTPGVADVSSFGGNLKQWQIAVQPDKLAASGITMWEVFSSLEKNNQNTGGAYIEKGPTALFIRSEGLLNSPEEIKTIRVGTTKDGIPIFIGDIAKIEEGHATRYGAMCFNNQGEVAGAVVMMLKGENSSAVIQQVKSKIAEIQKTLPEGVVIEPFLDRTKMVDNAISTVETNLLEGALIVIFVLVLFLGHLRAGLIVASVIPLAMLFAVIMMNLFGVSGNLMSLGALDFGLIIDGAVIIVEAVLLKLSHHAIQGDMTKEKIDEEIHRSASRMMNAAVFGQIIILVVYLPILSLEGIEGKMFKPMAQTVAFALLGAFLLSLTYIPMMSALILKPAKEVKRTWSDKAMQWLEENYKNILESILRRRKWLFSIVGLLLVSTFLLLNQLGGEFIPELEEGDFAVDTRVLTGSSLTTTIHATQQAADLLLKNFPEIEKVVTKIGSGEIPTDPMPIEASDMMIILKDKEEWTSAKTFDELAEKMGTKLSEIPGISTGFQYPVQMRFNELMTGARQDVVCKIFGENLDTLAAYAAQLGELSKTVEGAKDLYVEVVSGMPQIVVKYNRENLSMFNVNVEDVNAILEAAFAGRVTGQLYEGERRFDIVVRMDESDRTRLEDVRALLIDAPDGRHIPLEQLAQVDIIDGPNQIQRENTRRRIIVGFNVRGRDVESVVHELQAKVDQQIKLPTGYSVTYGGAFENLQQATNRLAIAVPVALVLILLLLYFTFNSIRNSLLIFTAIPLSAIGGVFALWSRDLPFSISAGVGFIALFGVAVLNGIVLVTEFNRLRKESGLTVIEAIMQGTRTRLRPVLMTAAVASLGFLPMALSNGAGAEVQRPLATVVIGGLITATFLTLFVLPALYLYFEDRTFSFNKKMKQPILSIALLLAMVPILHAQQALTESELMDKIYSQNLTIQSKQKQVEQWEMLAGIRADINPIEIGGEYGQINSAATDKRFTVSQSFAPMRLYTLQRNMFGLEARKAKAELEWEKKNIQALARNYFYTLLVDQNQLVLLEDYTNQLKDLELKIDLRVKAGESAPWELNLIQEKTLSNQLNIDKLKSEIAQLQKDIGLLLNQDILVKAVGAVYNLQMELEKDSTALQSNPLLQSIYVNLDLRQNEYKLMRAERLPGWSIGGAGMTIKGWQNTTGTDEYFDSSKLFYTVNVGVSIPLFQGANSKKEKAVKLSIEEEKLRTEAVVKNINSEYQTARNQAIRFLELKNLYETQIQQQESTYLKSADELLSKGEISLIEWNAMQQQKINLQLEYLEVSKTLIQLIAFINSF
jgi:cobalt-zinc-cadmium resistance protein CzcA